MTQEFTAPAIILVEPQMAENIGAVARAMANFGLRDLRLVLPRDGWPNSRAYPMAAGAGAILDAASVFGSLDAALQGISRAYAATGRDRAMNKAVLSAAEAGERAEAVLAEGQGAAFVFGAERAGLSNDDVVLCDAVLTIPTVPDFYSLNLAQAVIVCAYAWFSGARGRAMPPAPSDTRPATKEELFAFFEHLERELDEAQFLFPPHKRPSMVRNLRNLWQRADLTEQDVRTLRGVITALAGARKRRQEGGAD